MKTIIFQTSDAIKIYAPIYKVFSVIKNVADWPKIFPPCQAIEVLETSDDHTKFYLTAISRGITNRWLSEQNIIVENKLVKFQQIETTFPFTFMEGDWQLEQQKNYILLTMNHRFGIKGISFVQRFIGFVVKKFFVDKNTRLELQAIANYCNT